jgi:hypothetical protein
MKLIYTIRFLFIICSISIFIIGGCQKDTQDDIKRRPPPTPAPTPTVGSNTNPLPSGIQGTTPVWSVTSKIPQTPTCGQQYQVEIEAKETVNNCLGYNYQNLYARAVTIATNHISNLNCPQGCSPPHSWEIDRKWRCGFRLMGIKCHLSTKRQMLF